MILGLTVENIWCQFDTSKIKKGKKEKKRTIKLNVTDYYLLLNYISANSWKEGT